MTSLHFSLLDIILMTMSDLAEAVRKAVEGAPCSERMLAEEAGIDQSILVRIRSGDRNATPAGARKVADALARWADQCQALSDDLMDALRAEEEEGP